MFIPYAMDAILNVGLTDGVVAAIIEQNPGMSPAECVSATVHVDS